MLALPKRHGCMRWRGKGTDGCGWPSQTGTTIWEREESWIDGSSRGGCPGWILCTMRGRLIKKITGKV